MTLPAHLNTIADQLLQAETERKPIAPIADQIGRGDIAAAYAVQAELSRRGLDRGRRLVGRKIGLTSAAVQAQLGVDQPDYGALFADMAVAHDDLVNISELSQPRVEAEVAVVVSQGSSQSEPRGADR
jgi:2-keto-4-pentenoate hydratase